MPHEYCGISLDGLDQVCPGCPALINAAAYLSEARAGEPTKTSMGVERLILTSLETLNDTAGVINCAGIVKDLPEPKEYVIQDSGDRREYTANCPTWRHLGRVVEAEYN